MDKHSNIKKKKSHTSKKRNSTIDNDIKLKQLYISLIYKQYKDCKVKIIDTDMKSYLNNLFLVKLYNSKNNTTYTISIIRNTTWKKIKKLIDNRLYHNKTEECAICCNEMIRKVDCNGCTNTFCANCYIDIYKQNKGLIVCPFCRFTTGQEHPEWAIEMGVQMIKNKLGY